MVVIVLYFCRGGVAAVCRDLTQWVCRLVVDFELFLLSREVCCLDVCGMVGLWG